MDTEFKVARQNILKLLEKRGYTIGEEHLDEDTPECWIEFTTNKGRPGKVVFSFEEQEGKQYVTDVFNEILENPQHLILVYRNMTNYALKMFTDHFKEYFKAEMMSICFLQKYLFDHPLVPDCCILPKDEKTHANKAYGGNPDLLPILLVTDPVAIALNIPKGSIVKETSYYDHSLKRLDYNRPPIISYRYVK